MKKNGFTLIEIILYIGIVSFLLISIIIFLSTSLSSRIKNQTIIEVENQGKHIISIINQEIREAREIISPLPGSGSNSLNLISNNGNNLIINLNNSKVTLTINTNEPISLNNNLVAVSDLSFFNYSQTDNTHLIQTTFTINKLSSSTRQEYIYEKNFLSSASTNIIQYD